MVFDTVATQLYQLGSPSRSSYGLESNAKKQ
jgi:hypothetical protein